MIVNHIGHDCTCQAIFQASLFTLPIIAQREQVKLDVREHFKSNCNQAKQQSATSSPFFQVAEEKQRLCSISGLKHNKNFFWLKFLILCLSLNAFHAFTLKVKILSPSSLNNFRSKVYVSAAATKSLLLSSTSSFIDLKQIETHKCPCCSSTEL